MAEQNMKSHIVIDRERCKGCELCVNACPQGLIQMDKAINAKGYHPAVFSDPQDQCKGCAFCYGVCPDTVITVYKEIKEKEARKDGK